MSRYWQNIGTYKNVDMIRIEIQSACRLGVKVISLRDNMAKQLCI